MFPGQGLQGSNTKRNTGRRSSGRGQSIKYFASSHIPHTALSPVCERHRGLPISHHCPHLQSCGLAPLEDQSFRSLVPTGAAMPEAVAGAVSLQCQRKHTAVPTGAAPVPTGAALLPGVTITHRVPIPTAGCTRLKNLSSDVASSDSGSL